MPLFNSLIIFKFQKKKKKEAKKKKKRIRQYYIIEEALEVKTVELTRKISSLFFERLQNVFVVCCLEVERKKKKKHTHT